MEIRRKCTYWQGQKLGEQLHLGHRSSGFCGSGKGGGKGHPFPGLAQSGTGVPPAWRISQVCIIESPLQEVFEGKPTTRTAFHLN